ncbi:fluoride efflux transporter CrcB [Formosa sediminum]|uniref:Fluoride-specific ion channel FluC n=1 Tax=Formosa sediminum TaxID=2594004 RepID=A0A516GQX0_9FLAO|nr:fluoride efflux transporter CrcB [Formosa sediminum]QDO93922.1 fluoride efflux transporter CrcB [Formosa sediminum]
MKQVVLVFIGGGFGSVLRYTISKYINDAHTGIPYGTFLVNILGSLLIGILLGLANKNHLMSHNYTLLLATGFCGGLTTFSTFAYENQVFLKTGDFLNFTLYTFTTFVVGFLAVFLGVYLIKQF